MGMEYGIRINELKAELQSEREQQIMDMLYSRLAGVLSADPTYWIAYDNQKLAILQEDEKWPDIMNVYIDTSQGELEGTVIGERYLYIVSYAGRALAAPWLQAIDEQMEQLVPGAVREEL
jgi:hypothetical protein